MSTSIRVSDEVRQALEDERRKSESVGEVVERLLRMASAVRSAHAIYEGERMEYDPPAPREV